MATIKKRGNSYLITVSLGYDADGKQIVRTTTWKPDLKTTEKQIEAELNKQAVRFEDAVKNGTICGNGNIKLYEFADQYLELKKDSLSPLTSQFYKRVIERHIKPTLGHLKLKDIKPMHAQMFVKDLSGNGTRTKRNGKKLTDDNPEKTKISPATIKRYLNVLQSIFSLAIKMELISSNPADSKKLTLQKSLTPKIEIFTKQEAAAMLSCLEQEDLQFQVLVQLAIYMGARRGELVALKFSDVDYEHNKITVERSAYKRKGEEIKLKPPKDYEVRSVTVDKSCIELIKILKAEKVKDADRLGDKWIEGDWLFTQWNGEIMNPMTPTKQFSKFLERNKLKHRKLHSLRHTSATLLLYGGVNVKQVATRLGHGDIETTNKYLHYIAEADEEAANVLQKMLIKQIKTKDKAQA